MLRWSAKDYCYPGGRAIIHSLLFIPGIRLLWPDGAAVNWR